MYNGYFKSIKMTTSANSATNYSHRPQIIIIIIIIDITIIWQFAIDTTSSSMYSIKI